MSVKPKIKICGITNLIDAKNALNLGADYIGFINIEMSPRYITITDIEEVFKSLSEAERQRSVFLCKDSSVDSIISTCSRLGFRIIQPYANLSMNDLSKLRLLGYKIFKPFRVNSVDDLEDIQEYKNCSDLIILDTKTNDPELLGGSGEVFDHQIFVQAKKNLGYNLALSGGLNSENITEALAVTEPFMVDVSSGVESRPGQKSYTKMKTFISEVLNFDLAVS
jgi:phosphoribosylanthranilate isomerase